MENFSNGKIVSFLGRRKGMIYSSLAQVEAYWHGLRESGELPQRAAVNPRGIEDALEYAFILERIAPGVARFRLSGMHLNDLMGMEVRGMPVTAMFTADSRAELAGLIDQTCLTPQLTKLHLTSARSIGRPALEARMFMAPLADQDGQVNRILGCLQTNGQIGRQPRRMDLVDRMVLPLDVVHAAPKPAAHPMASGFAEPQAPYEHKPDTTKGKASRPALRLVSSND